MIRIKPLFYQSSNFRLITNFMDSYNFIEIQVWRMKVTIGSFIVTPVNKIVRWWKTTSLYKIKKYWEAKKEQVDNDLLTVSICNDPMNGCSGDFYEDGVRRDWAINMTILEYEQMVPSWARDYIDGKIEKYYENGHKKIEKERRELYEKLN